MMFTLLMALSKSCLKYHNSRYYSNISQCSLDQLSSDVGTIHRCIPEEFQGLAPEKVIDIQNLIKTGKYTLSPFRLVVFLAKNDAVYAPNNSYILHLQINSKNCYGWVAPIPEDNLVLIALGHMLNRRYLDLDIHYSYSFGLKTYPSDYYAHIRSSFKEPISRVYKIDMNRSLFVINRDSILSRLKPIVQSDDIMELIRSFLYMPVIWNGIEVSSLKDSIPPSGYFTKVLLHFYLIELDSQFYRLFPMSFFLYYNGKRTFILMLYAFGTLSIKKI